MARKVSARVVLDRSMFDAFALGLADGLLDLGYAMVEQAQPDVPDRPPFGKGLVRTGGAVVLLDGKKVGGNATAPRGAARRVKGRLAMFAGFGFPAHFLELGTIHIAARPFFTPAVLSVLPSAGARLRPRVAQRLGQGGTRKRGLAERLREDPNVKALLGGR